MLFEVCVSTHALLQLDRKDFRAPLPALSCSGSSVLPLTWYCSMPPTVFLLLQGDMNRKIAEHALNTHSSRSHCIFAIHIEVSVTCLPLSLLSHSFTSLSLSSQSRSRTHSNAEYTISKLNLVDLAGSERLSKTNVSIHHSRTSCCTSTNCALKLYHYTTFNCLSLPFSLPSSLSPHSSSFPSTLSTVFWCYTEGSHVHQQVSLLPGTGKM